jgi:hypothetical protein
MKNALREIFKASLFQISLVAVVGVIFYSLRPTGVLEMARVPFLIAFGTSMLFLLIAAGIEGYFENKAVSFKRWESEHASSNNGKLLSFFVNWSYYLAVALSVLLFLYILAPISPGSLLYIMAGFVVINTCKYFFRKNRRSAIETSDSET